MALRESLTATKKFAGVSYLSIALITNNIGDIYISNNNLYSFALSWDLAFTAIVTGEVIV